MIPVYYQCVPDRLYCLPSYLYPLFRFLNRWYCYLLQFWIKICFWKCLESFPDHYCLFSSLHVWSSKVGAHRVRVFVCTFIRLIVMSVCCTMRSQKKISNVYNLVIENKVSLLDSPFFCWVSKALGKSS